MPAEVDWLDQALDDLSAILDFISADSPKAAAKYVSGLQDCCNRLGDFSLSGRKFNNRYRCLVFRNHLVFHRYDPIAEVVTIATIIDARRDVDRLLEEFN